ncbi:cholesterol esterase [Planosporangium flavigriseum]|nr:cholesterol esterase [Planosporangium flavigriseum]
MQGRIRWRRFAAVVLPAAVATAAIMTGMANGAVPAQFAVSGEEFKVKASKLVGTDFTQYGGLASPKGARFNDQNDPRNKPVAVSYIGSAKLYDLCQSVRTPGAPVSLVINAGGGGNPALAEGLLIDMTDLKGNATFTNINIGQDASTLNNSERRANGAPAHFGQKADGVVIDNLEQTALSTAAGSFTLTGLHLRLDIGRNPFECF